MNYDKVVEGRAQNGVGMTDKSVPGEVGIEVRNPHQVAKDMLDRASNLVAGDRYQSYGRIEDNFSTIAEMWNAFLGPRLDSLLQPSDVASMLELLKIARRASKGGKKHPDNYIDGAGYAAIAGQLALGDK